MKTTTRIARLALVATTAAFLMQGAAFAQTVEQSGYAAMYANISSGLDALQVPTTDLSRLTAGQLGELAAILDGKDSNADKKAAAETVFRDALNPTTVSMGSAGAIALEAELKADLERIGLTYPTDKALTFVQVQKLLDVFSTPNANDATLAAEILSQINNPVISTMNSEGAIQLREQLMGDLGSVGIVLPADAPLSFQQVVELTSIFDRDTNDADKTVAAKTVLGLN